MPFGIVLVVGIFAGQSLAGQDEDLGLLIGFVPAIGLALVQCAMLTLYGQTLAKRAFKLRIVRSNGSTADFVHVVVVRSVFFLLISQIPLVGLIDVLMISGDAQRCGHDLAADTVVVDLSMVFSEEDVDDAVAVFS